MRYPATTPCETCPWRKSNPPGGDDIPGFHLEMMRRLQSTVGEDDAIRPIFACHGSPVGGERPCVGYLAVEGERNIGVRVLAAYGEIDLAGVRRACEGLELYPSFGEMLTDYESAHVDAVEEVE